MKTINAVCLMNTDVVVKTHFTVDADPFELAYTMLSSGLFHPCELSWINPSTRFLDMRYLAPRDLSIGEIVTEDRIGTYDDFINLRNCVGTEFFSCVCALDSEDIERISLSHAESGDQISRLGIFIKGNRGKYTDYSQNIIDKLIGAHTILFQKA